MRRFKLIRHQDISGVSGTGHIADGVLHGDGTAVVTWLGEWPTVTYHSRGIESVEHIHGHGGATSVVWIDDETGHPLRVPGEPYREQKTAFPPLAPQVTRVPAITDPAALVAMAGLGKPKVITCQVYEDGHERWSDEPTDAERIDVKNVRENRPGFRGVITLDREPS